MRRHRTKPGHRASRRVVPRSSRSNLSVLTYRRDQSDITPTTTSADPLAKIPVHRVRENDRMMPGENRSKSSKHMSSSGAREASPTKTSELEARTRGSSMIPLPRAMPQNPKTVKTEKNRLRLIMENNRGLADALVKERRVNVNKEEDGYRVSSAREPAAPRYYDLSCNVYRCPVRKVILRVRNSLFFSSLSLLHRSSMKIKSERAACQPLTTRL